MKSLNFLLQTVNCLGDGSLPDVKETRHALTLLLATGVATGAMTYSPPTQAGFSEWAQKTGESARKWAEDTFRNSIGNHPDVNRSPYPAPAPTPAPPPAILSPEEERAMDKRAKAEARRIAEERAAARAAASAAEEKAAARAAARAAASAAARTAAASATTGNAVGNAVEKIITGISVNFSQNSARIIIQKTLGSVTLVIALNEIAEYGLMSDVDSWVNKVVIETRVGRYLRDNPHATEYEVRQLVIEELKAQSAKYRQLKAQAEEEDRKRAHRAGKPANLQEVAGMLFARKMPSDATKQPKPEEKKAKKKPKHKPAYPGADTYVDKDGGCRFLEGGVYASEELCTPPSKREPEKQWIDLRGVLNRSNNKPQSPILDLAPERTASTRLSTGKTVWSACTELTQQIGGKVKDCVAQNYGKGKAGDTVSWTH